MGSLATQFTPDKEQRHEGLQEASSAAQGACGDSAYLSVHEEISRRREVRPDLADSNAASSIPSNIAEGCGCGTDRQLAHYATIAMGSASELECRWLLAHDLGYLDRDQYAPIHALIEEIKRMLAALIKTLRAGR